MLSEKLEVGEIDQLYISQLYRDIISAAHTVLDHEKVIIAKIFEKGKIDGITPHQLEVFAMSRIDLCLQNLGLDAIFNVEYNPVGEWFYKGITGYSSQDFFNSKGNQYVRDWNLDGFAWVND